MTFSCIKFKKKFKMKTSSSPKIDVKRKDHNSTSIETNVKQAPMSSLSASSSSVSSASSLSKSYSSNLELNTSTTGLCRTSNLQNEIGSHLNHNGIRSEALNAKFSNVASNKSDKHFKTRTKTNDLFKYAQRV